MNGKSIELPKPLSLVNYHSSNRRAAQFFTSVGCTNDDAILDCLRQLPVETIVNNDWVTGTFFTAPWVPALDGNFLTDTPNNLVKVKLHV